MKVLKDFILIAAVVLFAVLWITKPKDTVYIETPDTHVIDSVNKEIQTATKTIDSLNIELDKSEIRYDSINRLIRILRMNYANQINHIDTTSVAEDIAIFRAGYISDSAGN